MTITLLGLGPGDPAQLTREAWDHLFQVNELYLRTARSPIVASLPVALRVRSFDYLYDTLDDPAAVRQAIAKRVIALGRRTEGVTYAVPGHPTVGEPAVRLILDRARQDALPVRIVAGLSFVEPTLSLLGLEALAGLQLVDAADLAAAHYPSLDPDRPALIGQLFDKGLAEQVRATLLNAYPVEHPCTLVRAAGTAQASFTVLPLFQLDRVEHLDQVTTLYLPPLPHGGGLPALQDTVARLRAPDGCAWDREQTHQTLRDNLLEETYEALEALDEADDDKLCEELGDLLMQIVMHVQIATEGSSFRMADVIGRIDAKLKRRHPHVFGDLEVEDTAAVLRTWEAIKASERADAGNSHLSRLDGVPRILPSLARAQALGERAARAGFDWPDAEGVLAKVVEELAELWAAADAGEQAQEFGDLLFTLVNVARWLDLDAESALRSANDRFTARYSAMEGLARAQGTQLHTLSLDDLDALWEKAKAQEA